MAAWQRAGRQAEERSAYVEAVAHLNTGLQLLATLSDTPERARHELALQMTRGSVLTDLEGPASLAVEQAYARAQELCQQIGETPQLTPVLLGLAIFYNNVRGQLPTAYRLAQQALELAQRGHDPVVLARAHAILGTSLFLRGEPVAARTHLEQSQALYAPQQHRFDVFRGPVFCLVRLAQVLWYLG